MTTFLFNTKQIFAFKAIMIFCLCSYSLISNAQMNYYTVNITANGSSASTLSGSTPFTVNFSATISPSPGPSASYYWTFGDGTPATAQSFVNAMHTYSSEGTYSVSLFVLENDFSTGFRTGSSNTIDIEVTPPNDIYMLSYPPIDDAFLAGTFRLSSSNGSFINVRPADPNPISIAPTYRGYLKFDIPTNIQGQITGAELILSEYSTSTTGTIDVYEGSTNNWSENCIGSTASFCSGNNAIPNMLSPALVSETYNGPLDGISIPLSVVSNGTFTLILESDTDFSFWSNISGSFSPPELKLTIDNRLAFEAECSSIGANWITQNHPSASNGALVIAPGVGRRLLVGPTSIDDIVRLWVLAPPDTYNVYLRTLAHNTFNDEYFMRINNGTWIDVPPVPKGFAFKWSLLEDASGNPINFIPNVGINLFDLGIQEDGLRIDEMVLVPISRPDLIPVNPEIVNSGGNCASTLVEGEDSIEFSTISSRDNTAISNRQALEVYPNPFFEQFNINLDASSVRVMDIAGKVVAQYQQVAQHETLTLNRMLPKGTYLVQVTTEQDIYTTKVVKH